MQTPGTTGTTCSTPASVRPAAAISIFDDGIDDVSDVVYTGGMTGLPSFWWDEVLDGRPYEVDLRTTPYRNLGALRSACYREADTRHRLVVTSKLGIFSLAIQAWGNPNMPQLPAYQPSFKGEVTYLQAPQLRRSSPAPQDQPPSDTEPLSEEDTEALLGPCTCGQDPTCLPSCERFS